MSDVSSGALSTGERVVLRRSAIVRSMVSKDANEEEQEDGEASPIFGIKIPHGYRDWRVVSVAHEAGKNNDLRVVLGNDVAIKAFREESCRTPTARSLSGWPGLTFSRRTTTKSLGVPNLLLPGLPLTFSLMSRIQENTARRAAGGSHNLRTANLPMRPCRQPASPVTRSSKPMTLSSPTTHPLPDTPRSGTLIRVRDPVLGQSLLSARAP